MKLARKLNELKVAYNRFESRKEDPGYLASKLESMKEALAIRQMELLQLAEMSRQEQELDSEVPLDRMTYEEILEMQEKLGEVSRGLTEDQLRRLPVVRQKGAADCSICFELIPFAARVLRLPCRHEFHQECAFKWLSLNKQCPICKDPVVI
jgi:hypothetical protein